MLCEVYERSLNVIATCLHGGDAFSSENALIPPSYNLLKNHKKFIFKNPRLSILDLTVEGILSTWCEMVIQSNPWLPRECYSVFEGDGTHISQKVHKLIATEIGERNENNHVPLQRQRGMSAVSLGCSCYQILSRFRAFQSNGPAQQSIHDTWLQILSKWGK